MKEIAPVTIACTPEISLRPWRVEEAGALAQVAGDVDLCRFTSVPLRFSLAAGQEWVREQDERRRAGVALALAVADEHEEPLGTVNLAGFDRGSSAQLGYWLVPRARGKGLATVAARALAGWGFEHLALTRIELAIRPENAASRKVADRLGATLEGLRPESHVAEGRSWDMLIYSLQRS